jgi:hypothetical protein
MAFFFRRINCHFCGARSAHAKGSGIPEFQCASCEAHNFLDPKGSIVDTPYAAAAAPTHEPKQKLFDSFTRDPASDPARGHQAHQVFCNACLHNQQVYNESLANYLPDEDHPQYAEYEAALPRWKKALEERYPQICVACAPKAQLKINRADYYSVTDNLNKTHVRANRSRRGRTPLPSVGSRDDAWKKSMRAVLGLLGLVMWASMAAQVGWHAYGILDTVFRRSEERADVDMDVDGMGFDTKLNTCFAAAWRLHSEPSCHRLLGEYLPKLLLANLCLVWYNHGLRAYYNPLVRYDHITGQKQHFMIQAIVMVIRTVSYVVLSDEARVAELKWSQIVAIHFVTIAIMLGGRMLSRSAIEIHKWRLNKKIMPKPEEQDVLSQYAGPATERHIPQAASRLPFDIHAKKHREPISIQTLAPQRSAYGSNVWSTSAGGPPPSPQGSDSTIEDPMDLDTLPPATSRMPGVPDTRKYNPYAATATATGRSVRPSTVSQRFGAQSPKQGWEDMRSNLFSIEDDLRTQNERQKVLVAQNAHKLAYNPPTEQSPFRGRLPQAPMSMERRLRNPVSQVPQFNEPPVTQQKNFLEQMRAGIDKGKPFARKRLSTPSVAGGDDEDDAVSTVEFTPAAARTRGNLDLRPSEWHLPSDVAAAATGLEDLFGGQSFRISESPELMVASEEIGGGRRRAVPAGTMWTLVATGVLVAVGFVVYNVPGVKRWVFLGLYDFLVGLGV